ncbi:MAG: hypothetical protein MHMPM18_000234 [Marteilia pararefringens]
MSDEYLPQNSKRRSSQAELIYICYKNAWNTNICSLDGRKNTNCGGPLQQRSFCKANLWSNWSVTEICSKFPKDFCRYWGVFDKKNWEKPTINENDLEEEVFFIF